MRFGLDAIRLRSLPALWGSAMLLIVLWVGGCGVTHERPKPVQRYEALPPKQVPAVFKDSILELVDLAGTDPFPVSSYALVANLRGTGDSYAPTNVREFIIKEMLKKGFGSKLHPELEPLTPERVLRDPRFAIVRVDAFLPPGMRRGQQFDAYVSVLPGNNTTSLARGDLYAAELKVNGANVRHPGYAVDVWAIAKGPIFTNPAYLLESSPEGQTPLSLRNGVVMNGATAQMERPLILRLRQPSLKMARLIEHRIDHAFQDTTVAAARDEGLVLVRVPAKYGDNWQHFAGVMMSLYFNTAPEFQVAKARELAAAALEPDAPLLEISYAWEGLGRPALEAIAPLMLHDRPDVRFAAARAAAFIGDPAAQRALLEIAREEGNPFQINAVQTLGALPNSASINQLLRSLLHGGQNMVRIEAYRVLARHGDPSIYSKVINNRFILDIVPSDGPPIIYATRRGTPRIAVIGNKPAIELPVTFMAMDNQLSISSDSQREYVTIFYRGPGVRRPEPVLSRPDVAELIARLGGEGENRRNLDFSYADIVAIVQAMSEAQKLSAPVAGSRQKVAFVLQQIPRNEELLETAPAIPDLQRPTGEQPVPITAADR